MEIIQDEEYLEDADFDDIKRQDIVKKIGGFKPKFNNFKHTQHKDKKLTQSQVIPNQMYIDDGIFFPQNNNEEMLIKQKHNYKIKHDQSFTDDSQELKFLQRQKRSGILQKVTEEYKII